MTRTPSAVGKLLTGMRDLGMALSNVMPALRSKQGTYGTQRSESAQLDERRRASYPRD